MAVRHERVVLDLDDRLSGPIGRSSASVSMFKRNVDDSGRSVIAFDRTVKSTSPSIDQFSGRLKLLVRTAALLGPAFAPILTSLVPGVAGLATQLGFAAAAGGTAILAFQGVGDALKSVNEAHLEPTAANLEKAHAALEKLSPAARDLVGQLQDMRGEFAGLRDAAAEGFLPGVSESLDSLETLFPRFESILGTIGDAAGDALASGADSLASGRWADFFVFIEAEARPVLTEMGRTVGDLTHGLAELWMALAPLSNDFTGGLAKAADDFDRWASGLDETEGFQEFLDYVRETGPQVLDTLGSLANAVLQIGIAAAPLGGPVLRIIEAFADSIAAIADSNIGTPIMAGVAALSALRLATLAWERTAAVSFGKAERSVGGFVAAQRTAGKNILALGGSGNLFSKTDPKAQNARAGFATLGKTAAAAGGVTLAASGLADGMGLANTASLALMGTIAGPWGTALGGAAGLLMDAAAAGDQAAGGIEAMNAALRAGDVEGFQAGLADVNSKLADLNDSTGVGDYFADSFTKMGMGLSQIAKGDIFSPINHEMVKAANQGFETERVMSHLAVTMGKDFTESTLRGGTALSKLVLGGGGLRQVSVDSADMHAALKDAKPAMDALGYSMSELREMSGAELQGALREIAGWTRNATDDIRGLGGVMYSTADSASKFSQAMDSLTHPGMDLSAATDAWHTSINRLRGALTDTNRGIFAQTKASRANRSEIMGSVSALESRIKAQAATGVSERRMSATLREGRGAIIAAGKAAGYSEGEMRAYLKRLGATPNMVKTAIQLSGVGAAITAAQSVRQSLAAIRDRHVSIFVHQNTIANKPKAIDEIRPADGATVPGPRYPYGDKIHALLAPGEEVISNRYGQADRNRALLKAINANQLSAGGTVDRDRARYAGMRGGGGQTVVVIGGKLTGRIDSAAGPIDFMVELEQMAHRAARQEIEAEQQFWKGEERG